MEQHPIPQQISSYEFRLVGSMTLKQFFKLAAGLVIAFLIYSSKLFILFRLPLALIFGFSGFALAFLPINERPMDVWVKAFFKSVFKPTIFLWKKQPMALDILDTSFKDEDENEEEEEEIEISDKRPQLNEFLDSLPRITVFGEEEKEKREKIKEEAVETEKEEEQKATPTSQPEKKKSVKVKEIKLPDNSQQTKPGERVSITSSYKPPTPTAEPEFGEIPMPQPPKTANIIVGMTLDHNGKIIEDVIIEIQDAKGNPARALRTNRIGQFKTAAPLANGVYLLLAEKEGYQFDIIKIKAEGKIIPPLKIRAKV